MGIEICTTYYTFKKSTDRMENITGILHIINKGKLINALARFHIDNETKPDNQINDKNTVRPYIFFDTLILKYTSRGQSPLTLQLPIVVSLSYKLQHTQHARVRLDSQLHNKTVGIRTRSHTSYLYCNSTSNYTKYLSFQNHFHVEKTSITTLDIHSLNTVYE
jgi:hypothetical protein